MSYQLSRRDIDDMRSQLDRAVYSALGKSDSSLLSTITSCLNKGYERRKMADKIASHIDSKKASRLTDKILKLVDEQTSSTRQRKRAHEPTDENRENKKQRVKADDTSRKEKKLEDNGIDIPASLTESESIGAKITGLSSDRIKLMMANAQREIEERKKALTALKDEKKVVPPQLNAALAAAAHIKAQMQQNGPSSIAPPSVIKPVLYSKPEPMLPSAEELEKQRKIAELQARIKSKLSGVALAAGAPDRPAPLILDRDGKTVDGTGRRVQLTHVEPTLKANIRAKRREEFKAQMSGAMTSIKAELHSYESAFHDERVPAKPPQRQKRALKFHEPGKFQQLAERLRMKAQLEKLQNEISQIARKTGISSATKLALLAPEARDEDHVPDIEWWDSVILMTAEEREALRDKPPGALTDPDTLKVAAERVQACNLGTDNIIDNIQMDAITNLVEHPQRPPMEPQKPVHMPVFLTKKEQKKLRRQNRREAWKEEQEKVRLGLEAPAEPKLRISNLMRALGTEAVQDPTAIEARVREQMAQRQKTHLEANASRALTFEQRREKIDRKIREDTTAGVHVAVYRIRDLFECASNKFKVERNAQQLHMTGFVLLYRGCCVVVAEGGPKQHAKYKRLMLQRIKWEEDTVKDNEGNPVPNTCELVWEGLNKQRTFTDMKFKVVPTDKMAREVFAKYNIVHYWDSAYAGTVLSGQQDTL